VELPDAAAGAATAGLRDLDAAADLLVAPIMALAGSTDFRISQVMPVVVGALVPVLAWRLAADVAEERGLAPGRARTLAVGVGVTAAVQLPFLLHSTLPDSTMLFAALAVGACILMERVAGRPLAAGRAHVRLADPRLIALGVLLGAAALTRNDAAWLALTWVAIAWLMPPRAYEGDTPSPTRLPRADRLRLIVVPAVVAIAVFAPWAVRNTLVFGSPLPGQAVTNALFVTGFDVFAYQDPPTLVRYLAQGWPAIADARRGRPASSMSSDPVLPDQAGRVGRPPVDGRRAPPFALIS
jgi:hypothetical protein